MKKVRPLKTVTSKSVGIRRDGFQKEERYMLTITEIKSYISEAITQYQSVYVGADIVPVTVCPASRRRAVRNRVQISAASGH